MRSGLQKLGIALAALILTGLLSLSTTFAAMPTVASRTAATTSPENGVPKRIDSAGSMTNCGEPIICGVASGEVWRRTDARNANGESVASEVASSRTLGLVLATDY